ncbi:hypothetical protein GGR56DRAFT_554511 [Xylariaceae sp. FL0804]|nr:hypothetical protein GGR56DRAFT_554511 [Xylariaceae sp. FL0804]
MAIEANAARRASLAPLWTETHHRPHAAPRIALRTAQSPMTSPSPMSPKLLPSPMYPAYSQDGSLRRQDRALITSLDQNNVGLSSPRTSARTSGSQSPLVSRLEKISIMPPSPLFDMQHGLPSPREDADLAPPTPATPAIPLAQRRSPIEPQDQLRAWASFHYNNAKTADAFVIARSLRRQSLSSIPAPAAPRLSPQDAASESPQTAPLPQAPAPSTNLTVRAVIRPRAPERQTFLVQRTFPVDELRASIPDPPSSSAALHRRRESAVVGATAAARKTLPSPPAPRSAPLPSLASPRLKRRSSTHTTARDLRGGGGGSSHAQASDYESLIRDPKTVPIHLPYARAKLPVLAALMLSGHVRNGDVLYLPMPRAEAWPATVRYVYTGQEELLTPAVRENIWYLAGKV